MTIVDTLNELWTGLLEIMSQFVIPDWNAIIGLLPLLIFLGIVGPLLTLLPLGIVIYQLRKPRVKGVRFEEGPTVAAIGADGQPIFPPGLPHCRRDGLIYPSGTDPLRALPGPPRGHLPDVRAGPHGDGRHVHELRPRAQGQATRGRRAPGGVRAEARRRGGRLSPRDR